MYDIAINYTLGENNNVNVLKCVRDFFPFFHFMSYSSKRCIMRSCKLKSLFILTTRDWGIPNLNLYIFTATII